MWNYKYNFFYCKGRDHWNWCMHYVGMDLKVEDMKISFQSSVPLSVFSHSPVSQFHIQRLFARHGSSRTRPPHPQHTVHHSASHRHSPPCEKSGRVLLFHQSPVLPDTGWKGPFLFQDNVQIQNSEKPEWHYLQSLISNTEEEMFAVLRRNSILFSWLQEKGKVAQLLCLIQSQTHSHPNN